MSMLAPATTSGSAIPSGSTRGSPRAGVAAIAAQCLAVRVRVLDRAVTALYNESLRPHGLRSTQMNLLVTLALMGPSRPAVLCDLLHMERSTFSRNVERMRTCGWVAVTPGEDARSHEVSVTESGRALLERVAPDWEVAQGKARALLGQEGADALAAAADRMMGLVVPDPLLEGAEAVEKVEERSGR